MWAGLVLTLAKPNMEQQRVDVVYVKTARSCVSGAGRASFKFDFRSATETGFVTLTPVLPLSGNRPTILNHRQRRLVAPL